MKEDLPRRERKNGYETGNRDYVIGQLISCAILEREYMIDAWGGYDVPRSDLDKDAREYVEECEAQIRDFKRLAKSILKK